MKTELAGLWLLFGFACRSSPAAAYFATNTTVIIVPDIGRLYPYAYGPVRAGVSASLALTLEFGISAGPGYAAGTVGATTDPKGRVIRLDKQNQACDIKYRPDGSVKRVKCSGRSRWLGSESGPTGEDEDPGSELVSEGSSQATSAEVEHRPADRRLGDPLPCAACAALVYSAFTSRISPLCGERFQRLVPSRYAWPERVAEALCNLTSTIRDPVDLAYRVCRCCIGNSDCSSGVCSAGLCLPRKLENGAPCPDFEDGDCENGRCALDSYPTGVYTCCSSNEYHPFLDNVTGNYYCTRTQDVGSSCNHDVMCKGPGRCASGTYPPGRYVCCESGSFYSTKSDTWYCSGIQRQGRRCDANEMCASGVCSRGTCLGQKLAVGAPCPDGENDDCQNSRCGRGSYPRGGYVCCASNATVPSRTGDDAFCSKIQGIGSPCHTDGVCSSGICSGGVCIARRGGSGESCRDNNGCSNQRCGRSRYPSGPKVCCPSNSSGYSRTRDDDYCAKIQGLGSRCDGSAMCVSGVCSGKGRCVAGRLGAGRGCVDDGGCLSGTCARRSYPSGPRVCCERGRSSYSSSQHNNASYCAWAQRVGSSCAANDLCASSVCSGGVCLAEKIGDGRQCPDRQREDCQSGGACALGAYPPGRDAYVCCADGSSQVDPSTGSPYCAAIQGAGFPCFANELCESGTCSSGVCQGNKFEDGQPCPDGDDNDCQNGACGRASYPTGEYVCCPSGRTTYSSFTRLYYCADG